MTLKKTTLLGWALLVAWRCLTAAGSETADAARSYLERVQAESGAPGVSAAVSVRGAIVFSGGVGMADLQSGTPQNGRSVHNIGSVSKVVAVVAIMQLVEQGKVKLDAPIQTWLPWFPQKQAPITLRNLLTHTSGIRHYEDGEFGPGGVLAFRHYDSFEESTRFWRDAPLLFEPGKSYAYSSYAVDLLHGIVEQVTGQSFEAYLAEHVWAPAGMVDTRFDVPARIVPRRGRGYVPNPKTGRLENAPDEDVSYKYAGGGMLSTDEDLCRFGHAINTGRLLKPETIAEMYRLQLTPDIAFWTADGKPDKRKPAKSQGLVFFMSVGPQEKHPSAGHPGGVKGTTSQFTNYFADDVVVAVHLNVDEHNVNAGKVAAMLAGLFLPADGIAKK